MFDLKLNHEVKFLIYGINVSGIESLSLSNNLPLQQYQIIGRGSPVPIVSNTVNANLSITRYLISDDIFFNFNGILDFSDSSFFVFPGCSIYYNNKHILLGLIHLNEYIINCAVGSIPKVTTNFYVPEFELIDSLIEDYSQEYQHPPIFIPNQGSISIVCDGSSSNRVTSFDISIKPKMYQYTSIDHNYNQYAYDNYAEYSVNIQIDVDDEFLKNSNYYNSSKGRGEENIQITIKGRNDQIIQTYNMPNAILTNEQLTVSSDGGLKLIRNYIGTMQ